MTPRRRRSRLPGTRSRDVIVDEARFAREAPGLTFAALAERFGITTRAVRQRVRAMRKSAGQRRALMAETTVPAGSPAAVKVWTGGGRRKPPKKKAPAGTKG